MACWPTCYGNGYPGNGGFGNNCGCGPEGPYAAPTLPQQEPVASQLNNLQLNLFGLFTVTLVNGRGVWSGICSAASTVAGYAQLPNEGLICYLLRLVGYLFGGQGDGYFTTPINSLANLTALPTAGGQKGVGVIVPAMSVITPGMLGFFQLQNGTPTGSFKPADYNASTNNVSWAHVL